MQSDGTLHHIVYTKNGAGATHALYLDGVAQSLSTNNPVTYVNATNPLWIGKRGAATQPWAGVVDELRISTTVRTAAWIATEYTNQKTPASFLFVGPQQVHP
jgi:concanavalin A-like lectin/glucanase superfamily protein